MGLSVLAATASCGDQGSTLKPEAPLLRRSGPSTLDQSLKYGGNRAADVYSCDPKGPTNVEYYDQLADCIEVTGPSTVEVSSSISIECRGWAYIPPNVGPYYEVGPTRQRQWASATGSGPGAGTVYPINSTGIFASVTGKSPGNVAIQCYMDSRPYPGQLDIDVTGPARVLTRITVTSPLQTVFVGSTRQLTAHLWDQYDEDGKLSDPPTVGWSSSNQSVASVDNNGLVTGRAPGTASITAAASGFSGSITITVGGVTGITLTHFRYVNATVGFDESMVRAEISCSSGFTCPDATWGSANTAIATVSPDVNGYGQNYAKVRGVAVGATDISACASTVCASIGMEVYAPLTITISGRSVIQPSLDCIWDASVSTGVGPFVYNWGAVGGWGNPEEGNPAAWIGTTSGSSMEIQLYVYDSRGVYGFQSKTVTTSSSASICQR
jgi:hypothetical protein